MTKKNKGKEDMKEIGKRRVDSDDGVDAELKSVEEIKRKRKAIRIMI